MRIVVAPAPFKGAASAVEAAHAIATGLRAAGGSPDIVTVPVADGGEGTRDALVAHDGRTRAFTVADPLGRPVAAAIGLLPGAVPTAVVELAAASGYERLTDDERDVMTTSTYGTGELIRAALDFQPERLILTLGGSATNDGGLGIVRALGGRLLDVAGEELAGTGADLARVARLDLSGVDPRMSDVAVTIAGDVRNPLCGPDGAAAVFGPQKAAAPAQVRELGRGLGRRADLYVADGHPDVRDLPGAGAAGGVAGTMVALFGASIVSGADLVLDVVGIDAALDGADLCITGEGSLDSQSLDGKAPVRVARRARAFGVPVVCLCGRTALGPRETREAGFAAAFTIGSGDPSADWAASTARDLARTAAMVAGLRGTATGL
mgnify:CR=1 FL=1